MSWGREGRALQNGAVSAPRIQPVLGHHILTLERRRGRGDGVVVNLLWSFSEFFLRFFLDDKTSAPDVSYYGYEIWPQKKQVVKPFLSGHACFLSFSQQ